VTELIPALCLLVGYLAGTLTTLHLVERFAVPRWGESPEARNLSVSAPAGAAATASVASPTELAPEPVPAGAPSEEPTPVKVGNALPPRDPEYSEEQLEQTAAHLRQLYAEVGIVVTQDELRREAALHLDGSEV
jgi:hypothetical protein